jgi:xanthine/uracil permease
MASTNGGNEISATGWLLALMAFAIVVCVNTFLKGFAKSLPVLIGLVVLHPA